MGLLDGKLMLVIGGSSGMGRATALALGRHGARVVVAARRVGLCEDVAAGIRAAGGEASAAEVDVTAEASLERFFAGVGERYGRIDGAFNNVGRTIGNSPTHETPVARLQQTLDLNLVSAFRCMQQELRIMCTQTGGGAIVNNSSIGGTRGFAGLQDYCAAKWGLIGLSRAAALEYASSGIRINVIAPGLIATERFEQVRLQHGPAIEARLAEVPMKRPGGVDDVAETVAWLLGPSCGYLTGAVLPLDGGECAR